MMRNIGILEENNFPWHKNCLIVYENNFRSYLSFLIFRQDATGRNHYHGRFCVTFSLFGCWTIYVTDCQNCQQERAVAHKGAVPCTLQDGWSHFTSEAQVTECCLANCVIWQQRFKMWSTTIAIQEWVASQWLQGVQCRFKSKKTYEFVVPFLRTECIFHIYVLCTLYLPFPDVEHNSQIQESKLCTAGSSPRNCRNFECSIFYLRAK